jgi:organic radical activating enzyme
MSSLNLNDVFWTVQGEGKYAGTRALFVRMPHCNLKCTWCFDPETLVLMSDLSYKAIKDINIGDEVIGYSQVPGKDHRRIIRTTVIDKTNHYADRRVELQSSSGSFICTPDHQIWHSENKDGSIYSRWRSAESFESGDSVLSYPVPQIKSPNFEEYSLGYLAGCADGDGTFWNFSPQERLNSYRRFRIAVNDVEILNRIEEYGNYYGFEFSRKLHGRTGFSGNYEKIPSLYLLGGDEIVKKFENIIFNKMELSEDYAKGYLGGIFDTEGSFSNIIRLSQLKVNQPIRDKIEKCLSLLHFNFEIEEKSFRITGGIQEHLKFFTLTSPAVKRKIANLFGRADGIKSIITEKKEADPGEVINLRTECGSYTAGGMIVKNCDTEYDSKKSWTPEEFTAYATSEPCRFAVITGGEPMLNKHTNEVIALLKSLGFYIACETNGTVPILPGIDFVTCSPKRFANPPYFIHREAWQKVSEFKYVIDDQFDFDILDRHDLKDGRRYSLSPEFNNLEKSLDRISKYITYNPKWKISLQTHKWAGWK